MTTPEPPPRPAPPRPELRVTPLRTARADTTPKPVTAALISWTGSFLVLAAIAGAIALDQVTVRDALETSLATGNPDDSVTDITDTVDVTLIGSGALALVAVLLGLLGIQLLRARRHAGRITLAVVGALSAVGGVGLRILLTDAGGTTIGVLQWAPLAYSALVAFGALALFGPGVSAWLQR